MYEIKYWETKQDREIGESQIYGDCKQLDKAIFIADTLYNNSSIVCVEVQDVLNCFETVYHQSIDENK